MALSLEKIEKAHTLLKEYKGKNPYIIRLKNSIFVYKTKSMNDFEGEYILCNYDKEPKEINKIVRITDWYGLKLQEKWETEFIPEKFKITWLIGETSKYYHFYCIYRKSQEKAVELFTPKTAILTDFLMTNWNSKYIDFKPYNERCGRILYPYQEEAIKFLTSQKKGILASEMGSGKTLAAIIAALEDNYRKVLIVCPASVKMTWKKELSLLVDEDDITIVEGSEWKENRFTIINYDILKNFYEVPTETVKRKELNLDDGGNIVNVVKEKEVVSRKKYIISNAMSKSQLYKSQFDLVIIDEAHRLSNTSSGIFKIMTDLLDRSKPRGIYAITGTPITNRPINFFNILKIIGAPLAKDWKYYVEHYCDGKSFYNKKERDAHTMIFCRSRGKHSWYDLTQDEKNTLNELLEKKCKKIWITNGASNLDELQEVVKPYYLRRLKSDFGKIVKKTVKVLNYSLTDSEKKEYDNVWDEYKAAQQANGNDANLDKYKKITEGIMLRQWLAKSMTDKTIKLAEKCVKANHKVVIFCSFDEELNTIKDYFKDICVYHNGKLSMKKKNEAVEKFQNDPNIKVFIGNIQSAGVGLTLVASDVAIFNSFSWVSGDNLQAEDRIHRLNQKNDVTVYYQVYSDTFYKEMLEKVRGKQEIIDNIIVSENEK